MRKKWKESLDFLSDHPLSMLSKIAQTNSNIMHYEFGRYQELTSMHVKNTVKCSLRRKGQHEKKTRTVIN